MEMGAGQGDCLGDLTQVHGRDGVERHARAWARHGAGLASAGTALSGGVGEGVKWSGGEVGSCRGSGLGGVGWMAVEALQRAYFFTRASYSGSPTRGLKMGLFTTRAGVAPAAKALSNQ